MNCYIHSERESTGTCAVCGRPHCEECLLQVGDTLVCKSCAAKLILRQADEKDSGPEPPPKCYSIFVGLALVLGLTGAHYFYSGKTGHGVTMLIFSSIIAGIGAATGGYALLILMYIIAFFQACLTKNDGYGRPLV